MTRTVDEVVFDNVTFEWEEADQPLFENLSFHLRNGWTGLIGANGTGKTTLLRLVAGELKPTSGLIRQSESVVRCAQRTDDLPEFFDEFVTSNDRLAHSLLGQLNINPEWPWRWETLSHGERKRAQIAVALWQNPAILSIDEPTNHLDHDGRLKLIKALSGFRGVGLLVCHDREVLDALCDQCLFLDPPQATLRPGGISEGRAQEDIEIQSVRSEKRLLDAEASRLRRESLRRQQASARSKSRLSKKNLGRKDSDGREKIDRARLSSKDKRAGQMAKQLDARLDRTLSDRSRLTIKKQRELGISLPGALSKRNVLFRLPEGTISLGEQRGLRYPDLVMKPPDRIAIKGPNGTGKSTLISKIIGELESSDERFVFLPQEVRRETAQSIGRKVQQLSREERGQVMTIVSRLGSRPDRLLSSTDPSPGEVRKLLLALGMAREPHLIVMDEPTNHLDLPSIECLEEALKLCPCGLLLVSHDIRFLKNLCDRWWSIDGEPPELTEK